MKKCKDCDKCKTLFRRGSCIYFKTKLYYCVNREEMIEPTNCCESYTPRKRIYDLSEKRFDEVIADIEYLLDSFN